MKIRAWKLLPVLSVAFCLFLLGSPAFPEEAEDMEEARMLYKEALDLKKAGKTDEAVDSYEKAIRKNRSILSEDDGGLIPALKASYETRLASSPKDIKILEGLGFIHAVCYSDMENAVKYYEQVVQIAPDDQVKKKTTFLIDRLKAMSEMTKQAQSEMSSQRREENMKSWSEMEKSEASASKAEANQERATKLAELYRTRDDLDARIPQLEEQVKELEEEFSKATRLWYALNDSRYDRKRDRLEKDISAKKSELETAKRKFDEAVSELEKMDKADDQNAGGQGGGNPGGEPGGENPGGGPGGENPGGGPGGENPPGSGNQPPNPPGNTGGGVPTPPNDPSLPPDNPDFPPAQPPLPPAPPETP